VYAATRHHVYALDAGDGTEHWRVNISNGYIDSDEPPILAGETLLVTTPGNVHALATTGGTERWNTRDGPNAKHPPTVANGTVFVAEGGPSRITALDLATGEQLWEFTLENPFGIPAAITSVPETLYCLGEFGHTDFRILVLDATTGTKQTEAALPQSIDSDPITVSELAVTDDGIFTRSDYTEGQDEDTIHRFTPG
jgi:outer membrane protein assembly factor BamB